MSGEVTVECYWKYEARYPAVVSEVMWPSPKWPCSGEAAYEIRIISGGYDMLADVTERVCATCAARERVWFVEMGITYEMRSL